VLVFIQTLFDIIRLQKGPDAVPYSRVLFAITVGLWLFAGMVITLSTPELDQRDFVLGILTGVVGLLCYAAVIIADGKRPRLSQAITAIIGCGALLSLIVVICDVLLSMVLSERLTGLVVTLILLWSVPVEGHIMARTLERHWYTGVAIAMAVFVLQLYLYSVISPAPAAAV
jgi:drug/metabolite transporter (DMT)-like permease